MRTFLFVQGFVLAALISSCNAGTDSSNENKEDSLVTKTDSSMHHDMAMGTVDPLPEIPAGAKVYFRNLKNNQSVTSPVKIQMGADGIKVDSAGAIKPGSGHHHLIIDAGESIQDGTVVGKDSTHIHYGMAQKEASVPLKPGKHTLTLQFADGIHRSYGSKLAATVTVDVKKLAL
jgi:hypothetical protein